MRSTFLFLASLVGLAAAKSTTGDISLIIDGVTYKEGGKTVPQKIKPKTFLVKGLHLEFVINPATLAVLNYTLTGFADDERLVTRPTVVFASKEVTLTDAQRAGATIDKVDLKEDSAVVLFKIPAGKIKYQINDGATGGLFQVETETGAPVEFVHTLGDECFYFINPFTNKVNGGNGLDAVTKAEDPVNYHKMLLIKDSPQVAANTFQSGKVSKWLVQSGGRMGGVLGEDAVEQGTGATNCTSHCQAQNQIHGTLPVPPNPTDPTPLPTRR